MSDEFWLGAEQLRAAAPLFDALAERLGDAQGRLTGRLNAEGECWGADEPGASFAKDYVPAVQVGLDNVAKVSEVLKWISTAIRGTADSLQGSDDAFAIGMNNLGNNIGGQG